MPVVQVKILQGRTPGQKEALARALSDAVVDKLGVTPDRVTVIVEEVPPSHWMRGGHLLSDGALEGGMHD